MLCRLESSYIDVNVWHYWSARTCNFGIRFDFLSKWCLNCKIRLVLDWQGFGVFNICVLVLFHNNFIIQHREHNPLFCRRGFMHLLWVDGRSSHNTRNFLTIVVCTIGRLNWQGSFVGVSIRDSLHTMWRLVRRSFNINIIIVVRLKTWNICYFFELLPNLPSVFCIYWVSFKNMFTLFVWVYSPLSDKLLSVLLNFLDPFIGIGVVKYLKMVHRFFLLILGEYTILLHH